MKASGLSFGSTARLKAKLWLGKSRPELINTVSWHWTISELGTHLAPSHQDCTRLRSASLNSSASLIECFILHLRYYNAFSFARAITNNAGGNQENLFFQVPSALI